MTLAARRSARAVFRQAAPVFDVPGRIPPEQGLSSAELAVVDQLAAYFGARDSASHGVLPVALVTRLESLGLSRRAIRTASRITIELALTGRNRWGSPSKPDPGQTATAVRTVAADEPTWRARYLLRAAERLTEAEQQGEFTRALAKERRYLSLHRQAGIQRQAGARQADDARGRSRTGLLIWRGGTCPRCAPRDGTVITPGQQLPPIHPGCSCFCEPF